MAFARFDRSRWPVVIAELDGKPTDADVDAYLAEIGKLLQEETQGVLILDTTRAAVPAHEQRQRMGLWLREHRSSMAKRGAGCAFVMASGLGRFVLTSIFLIQRPPMPYTVVATLDEALAWANAQLPRR